MLISFGTNCKTQDWCRVTRLDDFSPIGRLFLFGQFLKITEEAKIMGVLFQRKNVVYYDKKLVRLHFGRFFLQAHLVNLLVRSQLLVSVRVIGLINNT
jgi:hypothetical protein